MELPAEEFFEVNDGDDFGWPYCYFNQFENKKFLNPEYGGDGVITERCEGVKLPLVGLLGAHRTCWMVMTLVTTGQVTAICLPHILMGACGFVMIPISKTVSMTMPL